MKVRIKKHLRKGRVVRSHIRSYKPLPKSEFIYDLDTPGIEGKGLKQLRKSNKPNKLK